MLLFSLYYQGPSPPPPPKKACFPSNSKVKLENGKLVKMSDLEIEDKVQTSMFPQFVQFYLINYFSLFTLNHFEQKTFC